MPNESRMVVDEYAKVDTIPIGDHSPNAVHAFDDCRKRGGDFGTRRFVR